MKLTDFKNTLQQMLDKEMRIAGELNEIEMQLEIK